jgi:hypothetical protein
VIDHQPGREGPVEIDCVEVAPPEPGVEGAVLRVNGRWTRGWLRPPSTPALLVGEQRLEALSGFEDRRNDRWQASFAVPSALRPALTHDLALDVAGRRIALPAPAAPDEPGADVVHSEVLVDRRAARAEHAQTPRVVETEETLSALDAERGRLELALERSGTDGRSAVHDLREAERQLQQRAAADRKDLERLEAELREREVSQRRLEDALESLRQRVGAVVDAERIRAAGGAVLDLVALAVEALDQAEQRIEEVQAAARVLEVGLARERAERAAHEEALQRRIAEPASDAAEQRLSGLLERLAVLEERAQQELSTEAMRPPEHVPRPGAGGWVAPALLALATADAPAAGRLAVALLPAQAQATGLELEADVVLDGTGAWRVAASPDGAAAVPLHAPRSGGETDFLLTTEPVAFVDFVAGRRRMRGRPRIFVQGSRRRARRLRGLATSAPTGLGEALRAGIDLRAELAWRAVAAAIVPAWTTGARFTVAFEAGTTAPFYVHAEDGAPIAVDGDPGPDAPAATICGSDRAIVALLAAEQPDEGDKASIRGELGAVRALRDWVARAQDPARKIA